MSYVATYLTITFIKSDFKLEFQNICSTVFIKATHSIALHIYIISLYTLVIPTVPYATNKTNHNLKPHLNRL